MKEATDLSSRLNRMYHRSEWICSACPGLSGAFPRTARPLYVYNTYRQYRESKTHITVSKAVYEGLHRTIGRRRISQFIDKLARPTSCRKTWKPRTGTWPPTRRANGEALDWSEGVISDSSLRNSHASR